MLYIISEFKIFLLTSSYVLEIFDSKLISEKDFLLKYHNQSVRITKSGTKNIAIYKNLYFYRNYSRKII